MRPILPPNRTGLTHSFKVAFDPNSLFKNQQQVLIKSNHFCNKTLWEEENKKVYFRKKGVNNFLILFRKYIKDNSNNCASCDFHNNTFTFLLFVKVLLKHLETSAFQFSKPDCFFI